MDLSDCFIMIRLKLNYLWQKFYAGDTVFPWRKTHLKGFISEELMLLNCGVGEDFWESLGLQGDPASPS